MKTIEIPNAEDIENLRNEYFTLKAEAEAIDPKIRELEDQLKAAQARRHELESTKYHYGLVRRAMDAVNEAVRKSNDSKLPVLDETHYGPRVIRNVTDKWIVVAYFGQANERRYNITNGWLERTRSGYDTVDHVKALKLWKEHQSQPAQPYARHQSQNETVPLRARKMQRVQS